MTGNSSKTLRGIAVVLLLVMMLTSFGTFGASAAGDYVNGSESLYRTSLDDVEKFLTSTTYDDYRSMYGDYGYGKTIEVDISLYSPDDSTGDIRITEIGGRKAIVCGDNSTVNWKFDFDSNVLYNIYIEYYTGDFDLGDDNLYSKSATAERYVLIDGLVPFKEARSVEFEKAWEDVYYEMKDGKYVYDNNGDKVFYTSTSERFINDYALSADINNRPYITDVNNNELKPDKQLVAEWAGKYIYDSTGYFSEPLSFYFEKGTHLLGFQAIREPLAISRIVLTAAETTPSYEEYLSAHGDKDYTGDDSIVVQAEYAIKTSENTIYQLNDRSSAYSEPQHSALVRLNEIGGDKWQYVGQWVEWQVEVPEEGYYSIIPRSKQSYYSGIYVSRKIYINGELPFKEANNLRFVYSSDWRTDPLNDGNTNFKFYLNKGINTIRMEVVLGDMSEILNTVENSLSAINGYYRKILMITGPDADKGRDYNFDKLIPDVLKGLLNESKNLYRVSELISQLTGDKGEHSATLDRVALVCERMGTYPSTIAGQMSTLKDYSASLGTWLSDTQNQPLDIDYISVQAVQKEAPEAEPGFFADLWYEIQKFFQSFFNDYNSLGSTSESGAAESDVDVVVWTASSRDQAQIIRSLVDDEFSPNYQGINVDIKLVAGGTLLPATLAGTGPDVYLGGGQGDPVNYAIRSAVLSLNTKTGNTNVGYNFTDLKNSVWNEKNENGEYKYPEFHDLIESGTVKSFEEVSEWFADEAMIPLTLYGETYAIPMTMSFSMMFYRKDIFVELGIEVPNTWDDFYDIIYTMQSNSLDIGFPTGTGGSMIFMYQQDESLYEEGNYDYYLELFRRYYYDGDYDSITDSQLKELDDSLAANGYTYVDEEGNTITKTDGMKINLDSDISLSAFKDACQFFTMYDFPVTYDFANRFRSGEMPLAVSDYTSYNTLIVFAPEINGLWEFTPLPGMADELTQEINNVTIGGVSTIMMMRSVEDEATAFGAWSFMQWYMSADIQSAYGNEMVALLGPSAKQPTANIEALERMSWSTDELHNLQSQFKAVACTPEYPGSYIISRYTNFAFLDVKNNKADPIEEMRSYINDINVELTRKREEFKLPTADTIKAMERAVNEKYNNWATDNKKGGDK